MLSSLLKGKKIVGYSILEHGYSLIELSGQTRISVESICRYIGTDGFFICSSDHGHQFGRPTAYDAASGIREKILGKNILEVEVIKSANDLVIKFDTGRLEIICISSGYECYQVTVPNNPEIIVIGGEN